MKHRPAVLIQKKRDGVPLTEAEVVDLVSGVVDGSLTDAQLGALLMAGVLRATSFEETAHWTRAMRDSGRVYDFSSIDGLKVDKHSTGGVGDKVSLVLAPLVAACGLPVPMVSGRGLGHTGGTVDKLESIPGFRMGLSPREFHDALDSIGVAMSSATQDIAPADRRMYATRDVTGTVESVSWITSSILSKKLAEGIDALVLDVKCGRGAFMKDLDAAKALATSLVETAELLGCRTVARLTDMDRPLGEAVGNAIEVVESIECLRGRGPADLRECVLLLARDMLRLGGQEEGLAETALDDGRALAKFRAMVERQGGDARVVDNPETVLPQAPEVGVVASARDGFVADLDPLAVGHCCVELGGGRRVASDAVDPSVGIVCLRRPEDRVQKGEDLCRIHARTRADLERVSSVLGKAFVIADEPPVSVPLLRDTVVRATP